MNRLIILSSLVILCVYQSCKEKEEEEVMCTEEFRMIGITVTGDSLTDYYTVRNSNLDTIRFTDDAGFPYENWYTILNDNYQSKIANSQDSFTFIGEVNDTIVVNEQYVIRADECHIEKVSGVSEIDL